MPKYSQTVLDETQGRAIKFLDGARLPPIRALLGTRGYDDEDHEEGWELLLKASGRGRKTSSVVANPAAQDAAVVVDQWDEPTFKVARSVLARKYLDQLSFVFDNLEAGEGAWSIVSVTTFLDRLDVLESGEGRKPTHKADKAALDRLAKSGITKQERARLRGLVELAKQAAPAPDAGPLEAYEQAEAERLAALEELRGWYDEWAGVAHAVIKRRDYLIRLGLAKRKAPSKKPAAGGGETPAENA